jgi:hypothetical protein
VRWWALLGAVVLVAYLGVWFISPRFAIDMPSLVDDWSSLSRSGDALAELVRLDNPEEGRFAPAVAVWSYLQWHTFDAPTGLVGPNVWNVLRLLVLVGGLCLLTAVALPERRGDWNAVLDASLAAIPAFAVVTVPKFARDLARFGPQEPMLVGALALGGALLVLAARSLLTPDRRVRGTTVALAVAGGLVWIVGAYFKETSVCAIPLIAGAALAGRSRLRTWPLLDRRRRWALIAMAGVVLLPLLHVAIETLRIASRGELIYGAEVGGGNLLDGFLDLYDWAHEPLPENARLLMWSALALTGVAAVVTRRIDWIALGALASGILSLAAAGQSGVLATRYYIPIYALFAVAFALSLARLPAPVRVAGVLCVFFAFMPPPGTREEVERWTDEELAGAALVRELRAVESSGCRIAIDAVDPETTQALPVLVRLEPSTETRECGDGSPTYFLLGPGWEGTPLGQACAPTARGAVAGSPLVTLHRCSRLWPGTERLVRLHRFEGAD